MRFIDYNHIPSTKVHLQHFIWNNTLHLITEICLYCNPLLPVWSCRANPPFHHMIVTKVGTCLENDYKMRRNVLIVCAQYIHIHIQSTIMSTSLWRSVHSFSSKLITAASDHPIRGEICVTYQRYTWCTWHHPSHSCHRPELRALWTGDTQRPRSCPTEVSGMNCSLELAWRFGRCACGGFGLRRERGRESERERRRGDSCVYMEILQVGKTNELPHKIQHEPQCETQQSAQVMQFLPTRIMDIL